MKEVAGALLFYLIVFGVLALVALPYILANR